MDLSELEGFKWLICDVVIALKSDKILWKVLENFENETVFDIFCFEMFFFQFINVFLVCLIKWVIVDKWMSDDLYQVLMWKSTWMTLINDIGRLKNEVIGWQSDIVLGGCPKNRVTKIVIESWMMKDFDPLKDGWVKFYFEDISVCDCFWRV